MVVNCQQSTAYKNINPLIISQKKSWEKFPCSEFSHTSGRAGDLKIHEPLKADAGWGHPMTAFSRMPGRAGNLNEEG
jgi:hypothetical protein